MAGLWQTKVNSSDSEFYRAASLSSQMAVDGVDGLSNNISQGGGNHPKQHAQPSLVWRMHSMKEIPRWTLPHLFSLQIRTALLHGFARAPVDLDLGMKIFNELQCSLQVTWLEHGLKLWVERLTEERRAPSKVTKLALQREAREKVCAHTSKGKVKSSNTKNKSWWSDRHKNVECYRS